MNPGDEVRLRHNPTRRGVLRRAEMRSGRRHWLVGLGEERPGHVPESQLELVPDGPVTPLDLLATGEFAAPSELRRLLTHVRVAGHPADMLYSMEATNTDFKAYQFKPVIKIIESPTGRVLLADEVGLGKTIEAGLIWTELRSRFDARRLLVLCPKALREKWRRELLTKFGIRAALVGAPELLDHLRHEPPDAPLSLIASTTSLILRKPPGESASPETTPAQALHEYLADTTHHPCFDLLVVDEAHHGRNPATQTHRLIKAAIEASGHGALLSATPVHNRQQDLFALLHLLDPDTFAEPEVLDAIRQANEPLIRARDALRRSSTDPGSLAAHFDAAAARSSLSESKQLERIRRDFEALGKTPSAEERSDLAYRLERVNLLGHVISRTRRRDVEENRVHRDVFRESVAMNEDERKYYEQVTDAVRAYADEHETVQAFLLSQPQRQMASCFAASVITWFAPEKPPKSEDAETLEESDEEEETHRPLIAHLRRSIREWLAGEDSDTDGLIALLRRRDTKYGLLRAKLREYSAVEPGGKLVLFSTFRPTIAYLSERLAEDGFPNAVLRGGQKRSVDEVLADFEKPDGPNILLSTEVGSEGVDLQFCRLLVNYDLPWNPMRVEQRIGRLDRIGQTAEKIVVWTLLHEDTIDFRIHEILFEKLDVLLRRRFKFGLDVFSRVRATFALRHRCAGGAKAIAPAASQTLRAPRQKCPADAKQRGLGGRPPAVLPSGSLDELRIPSQASAHGAERRQFAKRAACRRDGLAGPHCGVFPREVERQQRQPERQRDGAEARAAAARKAPDARLRASAPSPLRQEAQGHERQQQPINMPAERQRRAGLRQ